MSETELLDTPSLKVVDPLGYDVPKQMVSAVLADFDIDLVPFKIYGSQVKTIEEAERVLYDRQLLVRCYHFLTDDNRLALPFNACRAVVLGHIIEIWYEVSGYEVPAKVTRNQEARMAKAKETTAEAEAAAAEKGAVATKEPRVTVKSIISTGLLAGRTEDQILAEVKTHFPNGKADAKHVAYYRHFLVKDGKMEKPVKAPKPPKEPKAKKEPAAAAAAPAATKVSATKGAAVGTVTATAPANASGAAAPKPGRESTSTQKSK